MRPPPPSAPPPGAIRPPGPASPHQHEQQQQAPRRSFNPFDLDDGSDAQAARGQGQPAASSASGAREEQSENQYRQEGAADTAAAASTTMETEVGEANPNASANRGFQKAPRKPMFPSPRKKEQVISPM